MSPSKSPQIRFNHQSLIEKRAFNLIEAYLGEQAQEAASARTLQEAVDPYVQNILALEDKDWKPLFKIGQDEDGIDLGELKEVVQNTRKACNRDPLLKRAVSFRGNLVFGEDAPIEGNIKPRFQAIIDNPANQRALFSPEAKLSANQTLATDGNFYRIYDTKAERFYVCPLEQIEDVLSNPDDLSEPWYYLRSYTRSSISASTGEKRAEEVKYWVPVDTYEPKGEYRDRINGVKVETNLRILDLSVNNISATSRFGTPDALPALPWAWAYSEGLRSDLKLRAALSAIAWLVKQKSAKGAANAGAKIATKGRGAGQTAVATEGTELTSMPRSGSVDSTELRPIAGMVATAFEISTVVVISDSGAASGSNAAETTLDKPSRDAGRARQRLWESYYQRVFRVMGMPKASLPKLNFPKISEVPAWRTQQGITLDYQNGGLSQGEYRAAMAESLDIIVDDTLPEPTPWTGTKKNSWIDSTDNEDNPETLPAQGVAGGVGALDDGDNQARADGEFD